MTTTTFQSGSVRRKPLQAYEDTKAELVQTVTPIDPSQPSPSPTPFAEQAVAFQYNTAWQQQTAAAPAQQQQYEVPYYPPPAPQTAFPAAAPPPTNQAQQGYHQAAGGYSYDNQSSYYSGQHNANSGAQRYPAPPTLPYSQQPPPGPQYSATQSYAYSQPVTAVGAGTAYPLPPRIPQHDAPQEAQVTGYPPVSFPPSHPPAHAASLQASQAYWSVPEATHAATHTPNYAYQYPNQAHGTPELHFPPPPAAQQTITNQYDGHSYPQPDNQLASASPPVPSATRPVSQLYSPAPYTPAAPYNPSAPAASDHLRSSLPTYQIGSPSGQAVSIPGFAPPPSVPAATTPSSASSTTSSFWGKDAAKNLLNKDAAKNLLTKESAKKAWKSSKSFLVKTNDKLEKVMDPLMPVLAITHPDLATAYQLGKQMKPKPVAGQPGQATGAEAVTAGEGTATALDSQAQVSTSTSAAAATVPNATALAAARSISSPQPVAVSPTPAAVPMDNMAALLQLLQTQQAAPGGQPANTVEGMLLAALLQQQQQQQLIQQLQQQTQTGSPLANQAIPNSVPVGTTPVQPISSPAPQVSTAEQPHWPSSVQQQAAQPLVPQPLVAAQQLPVAVGQQSSFPQPSSVPTQSVQLSVLQQQTSLALQQTAPATPQPVTVQQQLTLPINETLVPPAPTDVPAPSGFLETLMAGLVLQAANESAAVQPQVAANADASNPLAALLGLSSNPSPSLATPIEPAAAADTSNWVHHAPIIYGVKDILLPPEHGINAMQNDVLRGSLTVVGPETTFLIQLHYDGAQVQRRIDFINHIAANPASTEHPVIEPLRPLTGLSVPAALAADWTVVDEYGTNEVGYKILLQSPSRAGHGLTLSAFCSRAQLPRTKAVLRAVAGSIAWGDWDAVCADASPALGGTWRHLYSYSSSGGVGIGSIREEISYAFDAASGRFRYDRQCGVSVTTYDSVGDVNGMAGAQGPDHHTGSFQLLRYNNDAHHLVLLRDGVENDSLVLLAEVGTSALFLNGKKYFKIE